MAESPIEAHAGPIAAGAGGLFALAHVGMFVLGDRGDLVAMMQDPPFLVFNAAYAIAFPALLIALTALYWRQAPEAGALGVIAFCTAATGTLALGGDMWFEGFAVPWLARVAPVAFDADRTGLLGAAWLVSVVLFSLGWALFGLASLRGRVLPRASSIGVAVGGVLAFQAAMPPWGVGLGLAVAVTGVQIMRQDRDRRSGRTRPGPEPHLRRTAGRTG
jgi:hypothetical protein